MALKFTELDFLSAVFRPSKSGPLTGLRRRKRSGKTWNKTRLNAFNKMPAKNQEILRRSGTEESYLRGETSLAEAKRTLRVTAVNQGIVKPLRTRATPSQLATPHDVTQHIYDLASQRPGISEHPISLRHIGKNAQQIVDRHLAGKVFKIKTYDELIRSLGDEQYLDDDDSGMSLLYYR